MLQADECSSAPLASQRIDAMSDNPLDLERPERDILIDEISDEALEAAAGTQETPGVLPRTGGPFLAATFGASPC
jgi:hypothetical protein